MYPLFLRGSCPIGPFVARQVLVKSLSRVKLGKFGQFWEKLMWGKVEKGKNPEIYCQRSLRSWEDFRKKNG